MTQHEPTWININLHQLTGNDNRTNSRASNRIHYRTNDRITDRINNRHDLI